MGCGGSRADAIEPRYYESWTRETESTWLTNTDTEPPPPACAGAGKKCGGLSLSPSLQQLLSWGWEGAGVSSPPQKPQSWGWEGGPSFPGSCSPGAGESRLLLWPLQPCTSQIPSSPSSHPTAPSHLPPIPPKTTTSPYMCIFSRV
uniref:BAALC binder of MAP3K1 and KLF4 n=1 Tax=Gopherus agassizii TaxID=38772 RepID=A0A452H4C7_9SAUR